MTELTNLVVLVPEAESALAACNALVPRECRLTAPAHITLVYPFVPQEALTSKTTADLSAFFHELPPFRLELAVGWFGREVLLLRPTPARAMVDLTQAVLDRWPEYPYYGGTYDEIEPHVSLAFGTAEMLEPIALQVERLAPISAVVSKVTLLIGPHERMTPGPSFRLGPEIPIGS